MRHKNKVKTFDRKKNSRDALMRGLVCNFVLHKKVRTTHQKARALRSQIEKLITLAKTPSLQTRRQLLKKLGNQKHAQDISKILLEEIAPKYSKRPGGYTRIVKLESRPGDGAEMSQIEFVS